MEKKNKKYIVRMVLGIFLILICLFILKNSNLMTNPAVLFGSGEFYYPSYVWIAENGDKYFITNSKTQVLVVDENNHYKLEINGEVTSDNGFNFVNNVVADEDGNIYITDIRYNDHYDRDARKRILKYTPNGTLDQVLYDYYFEEEDMPYIHSSLMTLEYANGRLYYAQRDFNSFSMFSIATDGSEVEPTLERQYAFENAGLLIADFALDVDKKEVYICKKTGDILKATKDGLILIYDGGNYNEDFEFYEVPNEIVLNHDATKIFFTDIGTREVYSLDLETFEKQTVLESDKSLLLDEQEIYYRITSVTNKENTVAFCCSNGNFYVCQEDTLLETGYSFIYGVKTILSFLGAWIGMLIVGGLLLYAFIRFFIYIVQSDIGSTLQTYFFLFIAIIIIFVTVSSILIQDTSDRYTTSILASTYSLSKLSADLVDGDVLERINTPDDYMNEDYQIIRKQIQSAYSGNTQDSDATYCSLYRVQNNVVYYTLHSSDDNGVIFPDELTYEDSDYKYILETEEPLTFSEIETGDGEWMYTSSPIYNSKGEMVGVCEVGKNRVTYSQGNEEILLETLIRVGSLTVVIFLIFYELINFMNVVKEKLKLPKQMENYNSHLFVDFTRIFAFIIFAADNFTSVIIPIMAQELYQPASNIPETIAIALPLACQSFAMAISGFIAGYIVQKLGNRKTFIAGIVLHIIGLTLCGFSTSLEMFAVAMLVVGIGMGTNTVCLNSYIVARKDNDEKAKGFSLLTAGTYAGTNCGVIIGTILSEEYGHSYVFFISAVVAILVLLLVCILYKKDYVSEEIVSEEEISSISLPRFLTKIKVIGYFVFAMTPYIIFASFVFYFLPLFASEQGLSETKIGIITLVYGVATCYLSPLLTKYIVERFGAKISLIIASLITAGSLVIFLVNPTVASLIIIVLVMGVADSFGYPALSMYFSELQEVNAYGENKSLGVYGVFDGIAQTIAPFIFGAALAFGTNQGIAVIGIGFACCTFLFTITSIRLKAFMKHK